MIYYRHVVSKKQTYNVLLKSEKCDFLHDAFGYDCDFTNTFLFLIESLFFEILQISVLTYTGI